MTSGTWTAWREAGMSIRSAEDSHYAASAVGILRVSDPASTIVPV
jgi:hypothetical protein